MAAAPASCMSAENGCVMFDCLVHLWEWIDPPVSQNQFQMDNKKILPSMQQPLTQQHLMAHHVHPDQIYSQQQMSNHANSTQPIQNQPNGVIHQHVVQNQYHANMNARSPLLENRHELYGSHNHEYARHYGANDNYNYQQSPSTERSDQIHVDHNVNYDIMQNIPKGYNAEVYQDYLKRNPPKDNQIYQNHQPMYRPNVNQYGSKPYLPYTNRIGPQSNTELLRRQYNEIQQLKMQQQLHYQSQAQMHQQQKFAERQLLLQQIHGIQPPPNLQNSIYSDSSYGDLNKYGSRNDFKDYGADIHKDIDEYAKNNEYRERDNQNKEQDREWQYNQEYGNRETERYKGHNERDLSKSRSPPSDFNNQLKNIPLSPLKSSESSSPSIKSPSSESRRSSSGQALRSPTAQRIPSAPVTISGILYKQGSDGLKVWRKRWFVLSEYCLFYYKSQDEEKLLGSVLLPSYKVSACTSEDKVMRKFAFKLEHANMRTYVLAALDQDSMLKWVKALTMAALMQNFSDQMQRQNDRDTVKAEDDDEVPGPTYANAPPKPRRSNDGYNSPGSDIYDPNYDLLRTPASQYNMSTAPTQYQASYKTSPPNQQSTQPQHTVYQTKHHNENTNNPAISKNMDRSDINLDAISPYNAQSSYDTRSLSQHKQQEQYIYNQQRNLQTNPFLQHYPSQDTRLAANSIPSNQIEDNKTKSNASQNDIYLESKNKSNTYVEQKANPDVYGELSTLKSRASNSTVNDRVPETRTPDAYSRAALNHYKKGKNGDYEDVYSPYANENELPKLQAAKSPNISQRDNISISSHATSQKNYQQPQEKVFSGPSVLRRKKMQASGVQQQMPRPHSADFLEYESKNELLNKSLPARNVGEGASHQQRPKSSLDINSFYDPSSETYYSEEGYAEKMRQSAQYLQQQGLAPRNIQIPLAKYASGLAEKQLSSPYTQISENNNYETEFSGRHNRDNVSYTSKYSDIEVANSNWMLKEKGGEHQKDYLNRSGSVMSDGSNASFMKDAKLELNNDGFMRSASARLPSTMERDGEKKVQQREESMKRLQEWKQRMLQSPLTRKSTPATISLARSLNQSRQSLRSDQYKPKTHSNAPYNSYSSDDEEETPGTEPQNSNEGQAGRSIVEDVKSSTALRPITPHLSVSADITEKSSEIPEINKLANSYENICFITDEEDVKMKEIDKVEDKCQALKTLDDSESSQTTKTDGYETHDSESDSEIQVEYTDHDLDEVLFESDSDEKPLQNQVLTVNKENVSSASGIPPVFKVGEDHYLPMSPRKMTSIESAHQIILDSLSVFDQAMPFMYEDNPYVEMNLGTDEDDTQTYELVCVNNMKPEPVYMELNHVMRNESTNLQSDSASNFADTKDPTIKRVSKSDKLKEKGDQIEVDEECYKEISLETPFSRFSISDNFRPASYYLGSSTTLLSNRDDFKNSAISPQNVPNLSASCDGLTDEALSKYILDKLDKSDISQDNSILKMLTSENQNMNKIQKKATSLMIYGSRTSIHDTLTRGEKIRHSRANLANDRNKINEIDNSFNDYLSASLLDANRDSSDCIDSDSFRSCNVERGSSRLSLESDMSGRFDQSNFSSEINSLKESEALIDIKDVSGRDLEATDKKQSVRDENQPRYDKSREQQDKDSHLLQTKTDLEQYELLSAHDVSDIRPRFSEGGNPGVSICSHARSSSTPVNSSTDKFCNPYSNRGSIRENNIGIQYKNLSQEAPGYIGSESSCSSVGILNSPISFYTKNYKGETLTRKNLNNNNIGDKIKEFETEKTNLKNENNTSTTGYHSRDSSTEQSAPYYYSDLSSQEQINVLPVSHYLKNTNKHRKLNNQRRRGPFHKKNEISHIQNPIHANNYFHSNNSFELAAARSVSVEFLSVAEKDPEIDTKNIYESTTSKHSKIPESINLIPGLICKRNSASNNQIERLSVESGVAQSRLNERVSVGSMSSHCSENSSTTVYYDAEAEACAYENVCIGEKQWDEDILWRNNLRRVSHRHARSMDDLDSMPDYTQSPNTQDLNSIKRVKKHAGNKVSRNVTYVNCDMQAQALGSVKGNCLLKSNKTDDNDVYVSLANETEVNEQIDEGVYEQLAIEQSNDSNKLLNLEKNKKQFEIDREKLRQWDLMSSGLMKGGSGCVRGAVVGVGANEAVCGLNNRIENASNEGTH
ncbi:uncharacterized protein LOC126970504 isoform X1 [Leptidea sinapis]|uniref:uncharacterized protein LOC126970504 isoform X1 n=2 Tax=Leptidea sinapis TaxID=189913 RepID=UPI0021C33F04|nr:uncharacterized protein LOC126970504 isoform X1 [Leptidea sinapis]